MFHQSREVFRFLTPPGDQNAELIRSFSKFVACLDKEFETLVISNRPKEEKCDLIRVLVLWSVTFAEVLHIDAGNKGTFSWVLLEEDLLLVLRE